MAHDAALGVDRRRSASRWDGQEITARHAVLQMEPTNAARLLHGGK